MVSRMAACEHVVEVRPDWPPASAPACEECTDGSWVSLRRCLTCGHVGCCDSSPGGHATAHHQETGHPMIETLQPGQDWVWCYVDELTLRRVDGDWVQVDLFFEAGLGYMRDHLAAGGDPDVGEGFTHGKGFPLGEWVAEMRRRQAAGELSGDQRTQLEALGVSLGGAEPRP
jgi:ubiquitin-hydrolase Zn-finger-containing protein/helicase associated protein